MGCSVTGGARAFAESSLRGASSFSTKPPTGQLTPVPQIEGSRAFRFNPIFCKDLRRSAGPSESLRLDGGGR